MKKMIGFLVTAALLAACGTTDKKKEQSSREEFIKDSIQNAERQKAMNDTDSYTTIEWIDPISAHLDKVKEGDPVNVSYRFKNTGDHPLVIAQVTPGCGCTVAEKPEEPIAPGAEGVIKAKFDSNGKKGNNKKNITVEANTKPLRSFMLEFEVDVE